MHQIDVYTLLYAQKMYTCSELGGQVAGRTCSRGFGKPSGRVQGIID